MPYKHIESHRHKIEKSRYGINYYLFPKIYTHVPFDRDRPKYFLIAVVYLDAVMMDNSQTLTTVAEA